MIAKKIIVSVSLFIAVVGLGSTIPLFTYHSTIGQVR